MVPIKKRYFLSSSDSKGIIREAFKKGFLARQNFSTCEVLELQNQDKILLLDDLPLLLIKKDLIIPTLFNSKIKEMPAVIVDDGAIPHILNGADVMVPGILRMPQELNEGLIMTVKSTKEEFLAIGKVLENYISKIASRKGKLLENLHYKGDLYYQISGEHLKKKLKRSL